jgi:hypothetical protein
VTISASGTSEPSGPTGNSHGSSRRCNTCGVSSPEVKNLEAISKAIDQHNGSCPYPAAEVRMNPFEIERLGWEEIRGLPIVGDPDLGTGRFRIVCSRDMEDEGLEEVEAVGSEFVTVGPASPDAEPQGPPREMPDPSRN